MKRQSGLLTAVVAFAGMAAASLADPTPVRSGSADSSTTADTGGTVLMQRSYDRWATPWVQISGGAHVLAPASNATLMALDCEIAELQRDRLARHLTAAECEHRMASIRADQDTSLFFRLDLRIIDFPGASGLAHLSPSASIWLDDDRGRQWNPIETLRGPVVDVVRGERLRRVYDYAPTVGTQQPVPVRTVRWPPDHDCSAPGTVR